MKYLEKMREFAKWLPVLMFVGVLSLASLIFGWRMSTRSGDGGYRGGRLYNIESNWGKEIVQSEPMNTSWEETEVAMTRDEYIKLPKQQVLTSNVRMTKSDVDVVLKTDYRRKGLVYYPTFVTEFSGVYRLKNEGEKKLKSNFQLPLPTEEGLIWDVELLANDSSEGTEVTNQALSWFGSLAPGEEKEIKVKYFARGLGDFSYTPASSKNGLQDMHVQVTVLGADKIDFPTGSMSPSVMEKTDSGWELAWNFNKVLSGPKITVQLFARENLSRQVSTLFTVAPFLLGLFLVAVYGLSLLAGRKVGVFDWGMVAALYLVFYPLFAYLVSIFDQLTLWQGLGLAMLPVAGILVYYLTHLFGGWVAVVKSVLVVVIFLGFFPLAQLFPAVRGFLSIVGVVFLLGIVAVVRVSQQNNEK